MRVRVKICGITTVAAAVAAAEAGADAVGLVFADSPRRVDIGTATKIASHLPPFVARVAVFRYPEEAEVSAVVSRFAADLVQAEPCAGVSSLVRDGTGLLPVFHDGLALLQDVEAYRQAASGSSAVLLEAAGRGGRGVVPNWRRAAELARIVPLVLAGGLDPGNVQEAIRRVQPHAVDVSSGVESSVGVKDPARMTDFIRAVREASAGANATI